MRGRIHEIFHIEDPSGHIEDPSGDRFAVTSSHAGDRDDETRVHGLTAGSLDGPAARSRCLSAVIRAGRLDRPEPGSPVVRGGARASMRNPPFDDVDQRGIGRFMMSGPPLESERSIVDP